MILKISENVFLFNSGNNLNESKGISQSQCVSVVPSMVMIKKKNRVYKGYMKNNHKCHKASDTIHNIIQ